MSGNSDDPEKPSEYQIGYRKPPLWSRFVMGQSGNPLGRPKKKGPTTKPSKQDKAVRDQILKEGNKPVPIRDGDRQIEMTAVEAIRRAETVTAIKGNPIAQRNALARYEDAMRDLAAEIEENHALWQRYCDNYHKLEAAGVPLSDDYPHPEDLIFEEGKKVGFAWTPQSAAETRKWIAALLLQAEKDTRALRAKLNTSGDPKPLSLVFAVALNNFLPARYRLDDVRLIMIVIKCQSMTKRNIERALREAWVSLGLPYRRETTFPAAEQHMEWLRKYLTLTKRRVQT